MAFSLSESTDFVFSNYTPMPVSTVNPSQSTFTSLPAELSIKILSASFVADIFSFLCVSSSTYHVAQLALVEKARMLGYGKALKLENYEDAATYIKQIFFRFTHERVGCFFVTHYRSSRKAIVNEQKFFSTPRISKVRKKQLRSPRIIKGAEKFESLSRLERSLFSIEAQIWDPNFHYNIGKRYLSYFCNHFFDYKLSSEAFGCFSFTMQPQRVFRKFSLLGLLAAILGDDISLFSFIFKYKNKTLNLDSSHDFYQDVKDGDGNNLMHMAAFFGRVKILEIMFTSSEGNSAAMCLQTKNRNLKTPLDLALIQGHVESVQYLFSQGQPDLQPDLHSLAQFIAKRGIKLETDNGAKNLLDYFSDKDKEAHVQDIVKGLKGCPPNEIPEPSTDGLRNAYLREAVVANLPSLVERWSDEKSINALGKDGKSLLEVAINEDRVAIISKLLLLGYSLEDPKLVSKLVNLLIKPRKYSTIRCLIRNGANISDLKIDHPEWAYQYFTAVNKAYHLVDKGDKQKIQKMLDDKDQASAAIDVLIAAALKNHPFAMKFNGIVSSSNKKKALVEKMLFDMARSHTSLFKMEKKKKELILKWIPKYSDDLDMNRFSLLAMAVYAGCGETVSQLLKKGWHIDCPGSGLAEIHASMDHELLAFSRDRYKTSKPLLQILIEDRFKAGLQVPTHS